MNRLNMIINALKVDPNNAVAIKHLVNFMSKSGSDANDRAETFLAHHAHGVIDAGQHLGRQPRRSGLAVLETGRVDQSADETVDW